MEFIHEILSVYGMEIIRTIFTALAGIAGMVATKLATKYVNTKIKREIARTVVRGIEQVYGALDGPAKLDKAMEAAADMLQQAGITVTALELRMLLEDALGEFNDVFNPAEIILEGVDVDDLDDDQLREVAVQAGLSRTYVESLTGDKLLQAVCDLYDEDPAKLLEDLNKLHTAPQA